MNDDLQVLMDVAVKLRGRIENLDQKLVAGIRCVTFTALNPSPSAQNANFTWSGFFTRIAKGFRSLAGEPLELPRRLTEAEIMEEAGNMTADKLRHVLLSLMTAKNISAEDLGLSRVEIAVLNKTTVCQPQPSFSLGSHIACP